MNLTKQFVLVALSISSLAHAKELSGTQVSKNEVIRRQQTLLEAKLVLSKADKSISLGSYGKASEFLDKARGLLTDASSKNEEILEQISVIDTKKVEVNLAWAKLLISEAKEKSSADSLRIAINKIEQAKELDQDQDRFYNKMIADLNERLAQYTYSEDVAAKDIEQSIEQADFDVRALLDRAKLYFSNRQFVKSRDMVEAILLKHPFSSEANQLKFRISQALKTTGTERHQDARARTRAEFPWKWVDAVTTTDYVKSSRKFRSLGKTAELTALQTKLRDIKFRSISFDNKSVEDVIAEIKELSKRYDPETKGINLLLLMGNEKGKTESSDLEELEEDDPFASADPFATAEVEAPASLDISTASTSPRVTMQMEDVPLGELLNQVAQAAGLKMSINEYTVTIHDGSFQIEEVQTEFLPVSGSFLESLAETEDGKKDWQGFFGKSGVQFPSGSKVQYVESSGTLVVTNTPENLEVMKNIIRMIDVPVAQVSIESKMLDVDINSLEELGLMWRWTGSEVPDTVNQVNQSNWINPQENQITITSDQVNELGLDKGIRDTRSISGYDEQARDTIGQSDIQLGFDLVFGEENLQGMLRALDQYDHQDVLAAPRVTAKSGGTAVIKISTDYYFPKEWETAEIQDITLGSIAGALNVIPSAPVFDGATSTGILLEVTPEVDPDNYTIVMKVTPQIVKFLRYDRSFDVHINMEDTGAAANFNRSVVGRKLTTVEDPVTIEQVNLPNDDLGQPSNPNPNMFTLVTATIGTVAVPGESLYSFVAPSPWVDFINTMPILESRKIDTSVVVWDGETVVLGGLISEKIDEVDDGVPILEDLPFVGRFFQNKGTSSEKTTMLTFVTARLLDPTGIPVRAQDFSGLPDFKR